MLRCWRDVLKELAFLRLFLAGTTGVVTIPAGVISSILLSSVGHSQVSGGRHESECRLRVVIGQPIELQPGPLPPGEGGRVTLSGLFASGSGNSKVVGLSG